MTLDTLLAILQQSEYDTARLAKWFDQHQAENLTVKPAEWTLKLKLIKKCVQLLGFLPLPLRFTIAVKIVTPAEQVLRQLIYARARFKLWRLRRGGLQLVAIAGSYAKTSTKHILAHSLSQSDYQVLMTPKSYNTLLGIAQVIQQQLTRQHRLFIIELGEYHPQDIPDLLAFAQPEWGILTPIGRQHLEIIGGFEQIVATMSKFVQYFAKQPQHLLVSDKNKSHFSHAQLQYYGDQSADLFMLQTATVSRAGTEYSVLDTHTNQSYQLFTPLLGAHQAINSLPALWLAQQLNRPITDVVKKLRSMPFIQRRHEPTFAENNVLVLDNSYNTNADSIKDSLALVNQLQPSRRLIITLGFTELGDQATAIHHELGKELAASMDYIGLIKAPWTDAIVSGFTQAGGAADHIVIADSQEAVLAELKPHIIANSVILFEGGYQEVYI